MKLRELLKDVTVRERRADLDAEITSVTGDSRLVVPGALFVAIPGFKTDGAKFIEGAIHKGASAVVGESMTRARRFRSSPRIFTDVLPTNSLWSVSPAPRGRPRPRR
jgi:UDP-N-acetylmuramyl tripeptide synthase